MKHQPFGIVQGVPPRDGMGGGPKKHGSHARSRFATPLRQPIGIGGVGLIPREKRGFLDFGAVIWRKGVAQWTAALKFDYSGSCQRARIVCWPRWLWLAGLASFLLLPSFASAQTARVPFEQGDHAFRFVLNLFKFQPLNDISQLDENADHSILVVFGETQVLDNLPGSDLQKFLDKGGAVLVATDRDIGRKWQKDLGTDFRKYYVRAPGRIGGIRNVP